MIYLLNENPTLDSNQLPIQWMKHHPNLKYLILNYNLQTIIKAHQLHINNRVLNMFDYFQGVSSTIPILQGNPTIYSLPLNSDLFIKNRQIMHDDAPVANINCYQGTNQLQQIDYLDSMNNVIKSDLWDARGFLSRSLFYDDKQLANAVTYDMFNEPIIEEIYSNYQDNLTLAQLKLTWQQQVFIFDNYTGAYMLFLKKLLHDDDILIAETSLMINLITELDTSCLTAILINDKNLNNVVDNLQSLSKLDYFLVTSKGHQEMIKRLLEENQLSSIILKLIPKEF